MHRSIVVLSPLFVCALSMNARPPPPQRDVNASKAADAAREDRFNKTN